MGIFRQNIEESKKTSATNLVSKWDHDHTDNARNSTGFAYDELKSMRSSILRRASTVPGRDTKRMSMDAGHISDLLAGGRNSQAERSMVGKKNAVGPLLGV